MSLFFAELRKVWGGRVLPALLAILAAVNLLLLWMGTRPTAKQPPASAYRAVGAELSDKTMEEKGIGRPSTYATIISVLQKRKYTQKEGKYLKPSEVAFAMTDMLVKYFPDVMDVSFAAKMEDRLDGIENGGYSWHSFIE